MINSEMSRSSADRPQVVRTTSSTVLFIVITALCVLGLGSVILGDPSLRSLGIAGLPVAVFIAVWALYRFPRVELAPGHLRLVNPLTTVTIPWNLVDGFDTHFGLGVRTHERTFSSWPLAGRGRRLKRTDDRVRELVDRRDPAVEAVLERFASLTEDELANPGGRRVITTAWNVGVIAGLVLALAWGVIGIIALPG